MVKEIIINSAAYEKRIAILEDGRLVELVLDQPGGQKVLANIYKGRVQTVLPGMQCAFVDIGLAKAAFLNTSYIDDETLKKFTQEQNLKRHKRRQRASNIQIQDILHEGQELLVQIVKEPISTKGAKVTTALAIPGRFLVLIPNSNFIGVSKKTRNREQRIKLKKMIDELRPENIGFIVRTIGLHVSEVEFRSEIKELLKKWTAISKAISNSKAPALIYKDEEPTLGVIRDLFSDEIDSMVIDSKTDYNQIRSYLKSLSPELLSRIHFYEEKMPIFDAYEIEEDIERSLKRKIWLRHGGYLLIDETEAMTVIDVNTGRNVGKRDFESTILQTNLYAAKEIVKQLRVRDIGGLIVIDFIDMLSAENRKRVENEMRLHLKNDRTLHKMGRISEFGLFEMTRKRVRPDLLRRTSDVCERCDGSGRVTSERAILSKIGRSLRKISIIDEYKVLCLLVSSKIYEFLMADKKSKFKDIERNSRLKLKLLEDPSMHHDEYRILTEDGEYDLTDVRNK
ncbi:MAG: Rne/Rng family ribonuclease [bacterium]